MWQEEMSTNDPLRWLFPLKGPILLQMKDREQKQVCFQLVSGQFCCFRAALLGACAAHSSQAFRAYLKRNLLLRGGFFL